MGNQIVLEDLPAFQYRLNGRLCRIIKHSISLILMNSKCVDAGSQTNQNAELQLVTVLDPRYHCINFILFPP